MCIYRYIQICTLFSNHFIRFSILEEWKFLKVAHFPIFNFSRFFLILCSFLKIAFWCFFFFFFINEVSFLTFQRIQVLFGYLRFLCLFWDAIICLFFLVSPYDKRVVSCSTLFIIKHKLQEAQWGYFSPGWASYPVTAVLGDWQGVDSMLGNFQMPFFGCLFSGAVQLFQMRNLIILI